MHLPLIQLLTSLLLLLLLPAAATVTAAADKTDVGLLDCNSTAGPSQQRFEPLSEQPQRPIVLLNGSSCITAEPCADRSPVCHLGVVSCDPHDAFQLFTYNRSSGIIAVPAAAAGPNAPPGVPQCFNVDQNRRSPGWFIDVFECGGGPHPGPGPGANAITVSQTADGQLRLRDVPSLCIATNLPSAQPVPPPPPSPPQPQPIQPDISHEELECGLKALTYELAARNLNASTAKDLQAVYDSLGLSTACNGTHHQARPSAAIPPRGEPGVPASALFVDAVHGHDAAAGTEAAPLRSITHAVKRVAELPMAARTIVLREGVHTLTETLHIGVAHAGLTICAYSNEHAVVSGGTVLQLDFRPTMGWWAPGAPLLMAELPPSLPAEMNYTELFISKQDGTSDRYTKARWPNGAAWREDGICTTQGGCLGHTPATASLEYHPFVNGTWLELKTGKRDSWNVLRPDGSVAESAWWVLDHWVSLLGGSSAARFDPPEAPSATAFSQTEGAVGGQLRSWQNRTSKVLVPRFSPRAANWSVDARSKPLLHAFNGQRTTNWGNHIFEISEVTAGLNGTALSLGLGGWHMTGAWGGSKITADQVFVEDVLEELDNPGEWFLQTLSNGTRRLWLCPEDAATLSARRRGQTVTLGVVLAGLNQLVRIESTSEITLSNLDFAHVAQSWVPSVGGKYAVTSNGDFTSLPRAGGAVWIGDSSEVVVRNSRFSRLGGSAIMLYGSVTRSTVEHNEFSYLGEGGVTAVGKVIHNNATLMTYPRLNRIINNHMHHLGLWVKAVAGYVQFLSARNTVAGNVIHDTPRSSILLNDNMAGGNHVSENVLWASDRETNDHGPISSWSRMPYINSEVDGTPGVKPAWNQMERNFVVSAWSGWPGFAGTPFNFDDGTDMMNVSSNVLVFGGVLGGWHSRDQKYSRNLILRPDLTTPDGACFNCPSGNFFPGWQHNESALSNDCVTGGVTANAASGCTLDDLTGTTLSTAENRYFNLVGDVVGVITCGGTSYSVASWQRLVASKGLAGGERGSTVHPMPTVDTILSIARSKVVLQR
jgi:hypothetical protein